MYSQTSIHNDSTKFRYEKIYKKYKALLSCDGNNSIPKVIWGILQNPGLFTCFSVDGEVRLVVQLFADR